MENITFEAVKQLLDSEIVRLQRVLEVEVEIPYKLNVENSGVSSISKRWFGRGYKINLGIHTDNMEHMVARTAGYIMATPARKYHCLPACELYEDVFAYLNGLRCGYDTQDKNIIESETWKATRAGVHIKELEQELKNNVNLWDCRNIVIKGSDRVNMDIGTLHAYGLIHLALESGLGTSEEIDMFMKSLCQRNEGMATPGFKALVPDYMLSEIAYFRSEPLRVKENLGKSHR
ncbi:MAG: hypothetical protein ABIJ08_02610 [Nanoarchaeota archaeon]